MSSRLGLDVDRNSGDYWIARFRGQ